MKNEAEFWRKLRPVLDGEGGAWWKVQDFHNAGFPDVAWTYRGRTGLMELKYQPAPPVHEASLLKLELAPEQRRRLARWQEAGGNAHVLAGVGQRWYLIGRVDEMRPLDEEYPREGLTRRLRYAELKAIAVVDGDCTTEGLKGIARYLGSL